MSDEDRDLEIAHMHVADVAADFVDGIASLGELREAVADWRRESNRLLESLTGRRLRYGEIP